MEHLAAKTLELNAIGVAKLVTERQIVFEPYDTNRELGAFILIDKVTDAGLIVITAFISPFRAERQLVRDMRAAGKLANFTRVDSPYEAPLSPEIHIDTTAMTPGQAANLIIDRLLGTD